MIGHSFPRTSWIGGLLQREPMPVLESAMSYAHQRQLTISHNIANVETPDFKREVLPDREFKETLERAIGEREDRHWNRFEPQAGGDFYWDKNFVRARMRLGRDQGPERHDENNVVIEHEMAELAKNTLYMQTMQQLYKKHSSMLKIALRERI